MSEANYSLSVTSSYGEDISVELRATFITRDNETAGILADKIKDSVQDIVSEEAGDDDSYTPDTPRESFEAGVWGQVLGGEKDFLTRREMAESLESIAEDIYPDSIDGE